jgi:two-component system nitrogen regulation response regulator GlnG
VSLATILVADDDSAIRTVVSEALGRLGYDVRATGDAATLWTWATRGEGDLVITDVVMPDGDGLELLPRLRKVRPEMRIIVMSAKNTLMTAVKAQERGAFEYLPKPFDLSHLVDAVGRALSPASSIANAPAPDGEDQLPLIGRSPAMQDVYRVMARLMGTDLTVMITGESGTGKELVARALHDFGRRRAGPFVALNMAAIPRELVESELFGHEKGAFTGAAQRQAGRFEQAQGGTLFLDEIGDMPLDAQTRLLRVLQEGEFRTVGGRESRRADVRIVSATHRDLRQLVRRGTFREDLFYRLNVVPLRLPALRERIEDVPALARHFLQRAADGGLPRKTLDAGAVDALTAETWPGNVRELENLMVRLAALHPADVIDEAGVRAGLVAGGRAEPVRSRDGEENLSGAVSRHLKAYFDAHEGRLPPPGLHARILREIERPLLSLSLEATRGNQIRAAALLGLNRNTLRKKIRELDIAAGRAPK